MEGQKFDKEAPGYQDLKTNRDLARSMSKTRTNVQEGCRPTFEG